MKRVLLEVGVELTQLKSVRRVPLVLSGGVIAFAILGTYEADDFADFAFLGHDSNLLARRRAFVPKEYYCPTVVDFARVEVKWLQLQAHFSAFSEGSISPFSSK